MKSLLLILVLGLPCMVSEAARAADKDGTRTFKADKRYLVFPCSRGRHGPNKVSIEVGGKPFLSVADTLITASDPDHWRFIERSPPFPRALPWAGRTVGPLAHGNRGKMACHALPSPPSRGRPPDRSAGRE